MKIHIHSSQQDGNRPKTNNNPMPISHFRPVREIA
jgi:hypothetical protein